MFKVGKRKVTEGTGNWWRDVGYHGVLLADDKRTVHYECLHFHRRPDQAYICARAAMATAWAAHHGLPVATDGEVVGRGGWMLDRSAERTGG